MNDSEAVLNIILVICGLSWIVLLLVIKEAYDWNETIHGKYPSEYFSNLKFYRKIFGYGALLILLIQIIFFNEFSIFYLN